MAGTTLTAINTRSGVSLITTAVIEGFPYVLTDGEPGTAILAYSEGATAAYYQDFTQAVGGLSVDWDFDQRVSPFKPLTEPTSVRFSVVPATDSSGASMSDVVGQTVFRRVPTDQSPLAADVDCDATTVTVLRSTDFDASGYIYLGPERIAYSANDTVSVFSSLTRGMNSPCLTATDARFARTHKPLSASDEELGIPPVVASEPMGPWKGRWCAIWVHRVVNGLPDTVEPDGSAAHLMFAGTIDEVGQDGAMTVFEASDLRAKIYGTRLNRDPFRAKLGEGYELKSGDSFSCVTARNSNTADTTQTANVLSVVPSGAAGANQINAGVYSVLEMTAALNTWLQSERAASRILFNVTYLGLFESADGVRGRVNVVDPTTTSGVRRKVTISGSGSAFRMIGVLGWDGDIEVDSPLANSFAESDRAPIRITANTVGSTLRTIPLSEARGTWWSQAAWLPTALQDTTAGIDGIVRVGDLGYLRAKYVSATEIQVTGKGMEAFFRDKNVTEILVTYDEETSLEVEQVALIDTDFKTLLLNCLLSTGTAAFNHPDYDIFPEAMGCAIPVSALGADFIDEVELLDIAGTPLTALIRGPVSFHDLFKDDFILRRCFWVWAGGRLNMRSWATPTSGYAAIALDETSKAAPVGTMDKNRATAREQADFYNLVKVSYSPDAAGNYRDYVLLKDAASIRAHGERGFEIKARNSFHQVGAIGAPLDQLVAEFAAFFGYTSRPWQVIKRTIDFNQFEQATPGVVLTITDKAIRDPATGNMYDSRTATGGLSGYPGFVVGSRWDIGGPESGIDGPARVRPPHGEVEIMVSPQRTYPTYVPCAQVDDTAAGAGYNAGTKVLTLYAHEHSESGDVADATRFVTGDEVLVLEYDPDVAGSALSWSDVVAGQSGNTITLTTGLAGFDTTKRYRVIYDSYTTVGSTQKTKAYQADDADGMISNLAQAYGFGLYGTSQNNPVSAVAATELGARYATQLIGDGKAYDVGAERDLARLANNLLSYKAVHQCPTQYSEVRNYAGSGTRYLIECQPIFVKIGDFMAGVSRLLSLAPRMRSTSGATASVWVTLSRRRPTGSTLDDVAFVGSYITVTYTSTSTTFGVATAQTVDIGHVNRSDTTLGGVGWLSVEISSVAEYTGLSRWKLGELA